MLSLKEWISKVSDWINKQNSIITVNPSGNITRSGTGDSIVGSYSTINKNGGSLTNSGSAVVVGQGIKLVEVSYQLSVGTTGTNHIVNGQLYINSVMQGAFSQDTRQAQSGMGYVNKTPMLVSVNSGDLLQIGWYGQTGDTLYSSGTVLTVKAIA